MNFSVLTHKHIRLIASLLLIAAGVLVYLNSFSGAFIFDDEEIIIPNPHIRKLWPPWESMSAPSEISLRDRPIVSYTLATNYALGGLDVWGYHALNLAIHILTALILFGIIRRTFLNPNLQTRYGHTATLLSFSIALIWLVHPLQTESVTYISQRSESLCGLFYLLTLYCFIRAAEFLSRDTQSRNSKKSDKPECEAKASPKYRVKLSFDISNHVFKANLWFIASFIFCALGMGTKAVMVTAPLMVFIYDLIFISPSPRRALNKHWVFYLSLASTWLIQIALLVSTSYADIKTHKPLEYAFTQFGVIVHYLKLSFHPYPLCLDYGWPSARKIGEILPPAFAIGGLLAATIWALFKRPALSFLGIWFFLILAPTSSLLPLEDMAFEHRLYLPLAAIIVLLVVGGYELLLFLFPSEKGVRVILGFWLVMTIALYLSILTAARNRVYHSPIEMWYDVLARRPYNSRAYTNLGNALFKQGKIDEAIQLYKEALQISPANYQAQLNWAVALIKLGKFSEAIVHCRKALHLNPSYEEAHLYWGTALFELGEEEEAIQHFNRSLELEPQNAESYVNLGNLLASQGNTKTALNILRHALLLDPLSAEAHNNIAKVLISLNKVEEAIIHCRQAINLNPDLVEAYNNLGIALSGRGELEEAITQHTEALRIKPDYPEAHYNLGITLAEQGKLEEATAHFIEALRIKPGYAEAHNNLGIALIEQGKPEESISHFTEALRIKPDFSEAYNNLGIALSGMGKLEEATAQYTKALRIKPDYAEAHCNLGGALIQEGKIEDGLKSYRLAIEKNPAFGKAYKNLGLILYQLKRYGEAIRVWESGLSHFPDHLPFLNNLAWILATCPEANLRDCSRAITLARKAKQQTRGKHPSTLDTLAAAYACSEQFDLAIQAAREAVELAQAAGDKKLESEIRERLKLYRKGISYQEQED